MHAVTHGVTRDQMMAQHKSNHIQVYYCDDKAAAVQSMQTKAAMAASLGIRVQVCGV